MADLQNGRGIVESIHLSPGKGATLRPVDEVRAEAGLGLLGDRYAIPSLGGREIKRQATLIAAEAIEAVAREHGIDFAPGEARRNLTTRGVDLNALVGKEFTVGEARLRGVKLCQPCSRMEKLTRPGVVRAFADRAGLRAEILAGGTIRVGDAVVAA